VFVLKITLNLYIQAVGNMLCWWWLWFSLGTFEFSVSML